MSSRNFLVSIYIVNHNYGRYLEQCIDSVLRQTYSNIELLIIDNESTDNSRDILLKYMNYPNIKFYFIKTLA